MTRQTIILLLSLYIVVGGVGTRARETTYRSLQQAAHQAHRTIPALQWANQQAWQRQLQTNVLPAAIYQQRSRPIQQQQQRQQQRRNLEDASYDGRYYYNEDIAYQQGGETVQEEVESTSSSERYAGSYGTFHMYDSLWNPALDETDFGFDITHYSFKYTGCHDVGQRWARRSARPSRYATFRLCPTEACSGRSTFGCQSNYGEYIVPVDVLVISLIEHQQARVTGYCQYCERCAALESYKQFASEVFMHKQYILNYADTRFKAWCSQNGYSSLSESTYRVAAQALWKEMRNGNYASNYVSNSNGYVNPSTYANGDSSRQSWNFQGRSGMSWEYPDEQKSWQSMGYTFGTWYDHLIYPGYYDSNGYFNTCWGYNSDEGFICLDSTDDTVYWDKNIFGSEPYKWSNFTENGYIVDREEYCDSRYSSSCYNQYDACMEILGEPQSTSYAATTAREENKLSLASLLNCTNITEDLMQYDALSFYSQWIYIQARNREHYQEIEDYNNERLRSGDWDSVYTYIDTPHPGLYVGPTCGKDGMTIKLAVYGDPNCTSKVKEITVKELLGYDPLSEDTDIFPNDCISCSPPEEEIMWYETEVVEDPVLPFCSMLYQLAGKCNLRLKPRGRYDPEKLYESNGHSRFSNDTCTVVSALNKKHQRRQSFIQKWADSIRMTQKAMSPLTRASLLVMVTLLSGVGVAAFLMQHMKRIQTKLSTMKTASKNSNVPHVPAFAYQSADMNRQDSGVGKARQEQWRHNPERRLNRPRSAPLMV